MSGHLGLHAPLFRGALLAVCVAAAAGCVSSSPRVKVLGVQESRSQAPRNALLVFVEVVNPTQTALTLSRLEYRVRATSWFESSGEVRITRQIGAESSAVVEISVPVERAVSGDDGAIPYVLEGKLFAREDLRERSWDVAVRGALGSAQATADGAAPIRVTVVDP